MKKLIILLLTIWSIVAVTATKRENIIFILADDHGYNDIGYHGSEIRTPTLDRLANEGVKLENYYVQPICSPTRGQLLSGRYQIHTGLQHSLIWAGQRNGLPTDIPTVADEMKKLGYRTHMVGKWHVGFYKKELTPTFRGFDSFFGYLTGSEDYYTHQSCYNFKKSLEDKERELQFPQQDFVHDEEGECGLDLHEGDNNAWNYTGQYSTEIFTRKTQGIIDDHAGRDTDEPLFLYLPFQAVHSPLQVPDRYMKPYAHIQSKSRREYAGMVAAMDEAVHNITETLKHHKLWDSTTIIFSTDNGGEVVSGGNNAPLRGWKYSLWEGGLKANGFVRSSRIKNAGEVRTGLMHVTDWFPTIVHLGGGIVTELKLDGFNQWSLISQGRESSRDELLHNIDPLYTSHGKKLYDDTWDTRVRAALRVGHWKIITGNPGNSSWVPPPKNGVRYPHYVSMTEDEDKNLWLFDIEKDPNEKMDLSAQHPEVVRELLDKLVAYNKTAVPCRYPPIDPQANPNLHGGAWGPWVDKNSLNKF